MTFSAFPRTLGLTLSVSTLAVRPALAQNQVASYSHGQPDTAGYEHFSFWANGGRRTDVAYAYGKNREDAQLRWAGPSRLSGQPDFKIRFRNGHPLYLVPSGNTLRVATAPGAPPKTFTWEYEGPVNGIGTFCSVCVEDAPAAMRFLRAHYLK